MNSIFTVTNNDLKRLSDHEAVAVFRELLWAEARKLGLPCNKIHVSDSIDVADGGIDATVEADALTNITPQDGLIKAGKTSYQIKTGDSFKPTQKAVIKKELFGRKSIRKENLGPSVRDCLDQSGTYVLVCFGHDLVETQRKEAEGHLRGFFSQCGYANAKIEVWSQNNLSGFIALFPSLALKVNRRNLDGLRTHDSWAKDGDMDVPFEAGENQQKTIEGIRECLRRNEAAIHVRVAGVAGVGKTRLVLEAVRAKDLAPQVLYCNAEKFRDSLLMTELGRQDNHYSVILILDECDQDHSQYIWNQFKNIGERIKIVSITNEFTSTSGNTLYYEIPLLDTHHIIPILDKQYNIPKERAELWARECGGYPRVAHLIGQNLNANPEDIFKSPDIANVWDKFIVWQDKSDSPAVQQRRIVLRYLSLFSKFGFREPLTEEAKAIAKMVRESDPNITWDRFQEIVKELHQRKILQGSHTYYITPGLLHTYLWSDWWEHYGQGFDLAEFSEGMPTQLLGWFYAMFQDANISPSASHVVRCLLSADGPFQRHNFLESLFDADFFLALSKADPKAALNCLCRIIRGWDKDALLAFKQGRRQVVWALENIAVWRELFANAARILLALAEAENETYSNNASGVFEALFSMAPDNVAPTEAPPNERLTILQEALDAESKERRALGLKACGGGLQTGHFTRLIGLGDSHLRKQPQRWSPKTYGEWYDAYRGVWKLVEEKIKTLPEEEKYEAARLLLNHAYGIGRIYDLSEMAFDTISNLTIKGYLSQAEVLQFLASFLHKQNEMEEAVRQRWAQLKEELTPQDFPSLMQRYVASEFLEDNFDEEERYVDQAQPKIEELAQQTVDAPESLNPELAWLTTTEAKRGQQFGYELGMRDKGVSLLPTLIQAQKEAMSKENASAFFLGGYFRALRQIHEHSWEQVLDILAQVDELKVLVPELTWRSGLTDKSAYRIADLAEEGAISFWHFGIFTYGPEIAKVPEKCFHRWIRFLLSANELGAISIALDLFDKYYLPRSSSKPLQSLKLPGTLALRLLQHPTLFKRMSDLRLNQTSDFHWRNIAAALVRFHPTKALKLAKAIIKNFGEDGPLLAGLREKAHEFLRSVAAIYPIEMWEIVSPYLGHRVDTRSWHLGRWLREGGIAFGKYGSQEKTVPLEELWAWVDEDIENRAWYVASLASSNLSYSEEHTCLGREILIRYGHREDVRRNIGTGSMDFWTGNASDHYQSKKQLFLTFKAQEDNPNILLWIEEKIEQLEAQIEHYRIEEERRF